MQFEVETGTASPTATSYIDYEWADEYHALYGNTDWTPASENTPEVIQEKRRLLMQATQSIDLLYGQEFKSQPVKQLQRLLFPRFAFYINRTQLVQSNTIPERLKSAVAEVALMAAQGKNIFPDKNTLSALKSERKQVEGLQKQSDYFDKITNEQLQGFYKVEQFLKPLLWSKEGTSNYLGR